MGLYAAIAGVVLTILCQTVALFIWGAKLDQRVASLEQKVASSEKLAESVARIDERTSSLVSSIDRIEGELSDRRRAR